LSLGKLLTGAPERPPDNVSTLSVDAVIALRQQATREYDQAVRTLSALRHSITENFARPEAYFSLQRLVERVRIRCKGEMQNVGRMMRCIICSRTAHSNTPREMFWIRSPSLSPPPSKFDGQ
jgi:hypothetical protein